LSDIRKKELVTISEAKTILEKIDLEKADQIQKRTLEYLIKFSKTTPKEAARIKDKLVKEAGLTVQEAVELINIMPRSLEELRVLTSGWKKLLPTETAEKILNILSGVGGG